MNNIFDYARNKINKEYSSRYDYSFKDVKEMETHDLSYIDYCEEKSKENIKNAIAFRFKAFWSVQSNDDKLFIGTGVAVTLFVLLVFLYGIKDLPLNVLILNVAESFFTCFVVVSVVFLYRLLRKRIIKHGVFYIAWLLFFLLSIPHIPVLFGYKTTQIGDFYEANTYTEKYYVIMSREPETVKNRKQYTLSAEIERREDYLYTSAVHEDYYGNEYGGDDVYTLAYHINYLYFFKWWIFNL